MAKQYGASEEKVAALPGFDVSPLFAEAEKAALRVAEGTRDTGRGLDDALYRNVVHHYTPVQVLEITAVATAFQFFNRFVDALRIPSTGAE